MRVPIFHDGKPANLQAAILDTEYWLRWLRNRLKDSRRPSIEWNEHKYRLYLAIKTLEVFLADEELPPEPRPEPRPELHPELDEGLVEGLIEGIVEGLEEGLENPALTPVQQAKVNLIKEQLRARQQATRATE